MALVVTSDRKGHMRMVEMIHTYKDSFGDVVKVGRQAAGNAINNILYAGCSLAVVLVVLCPELSRAQAPSDAWREPQDTKQALTEPDRYAWRLFIALNWPADMENRRADQQKAYGDDGPVVWESWKLSSGRGDEVFLAQGKDPGPWVGGPARGERSIQNFESLPLQQLIAGGRPMTALFDPQLAQFRGNENHINKAGYEFIRSNELFNVEGQISMVEANKEIIFPLQAKEVKAQWRRIEDADKPRYHWAEFVNDGEDRLVFGMTALHITTKDLPNWFWATFEHKDNEKLDGAEPWMLPSRDSTAGPDGYPTEIGLEGTKWMYYRLRGTQIDFVDSRGNPTVLANSQIEEGFQTSSSCITCHALASVSRDGDRLFFFRPGFSRGVSVGPVGHPDAGLFSYPSFQLGGTPSQQFQQQDFVWSLMRARRKNP